MPAQTVHTVYATHMSGDAAVAVYAEVDAAGRLEVFVRDRGVGFDPAAVGRVCASVEQAVQRAVGGQIDLILDGGRVALGVPSTVIDCSVAPARLLREGAVPRATLAAKIALA